MIKIGIYSDLIDRGKIKKTVMKYLKERNVEAEISYIETANKILSIFDFIDYYNIIIISKNNKFIYIKRNSVNYGKNVIQLASGFWESPLSSEKLNEIMINNNGFNCPYGIYTINNKYTTRIILYEDIEYFHITKAKKLVFLKNNEAEEIFQTAKYVKKELSEDYFVNCANGYLVNLYNIKKLNKTSREITLKSGRKIPVTRKNFQLVLKTFINAMCGIKLSQ